MFEVFLLIVLAGVMVLMAFGVHAARRAQQARYRKLGFSRAARQLGFEPERPDALALRGGGGPDHAVHGELDGAPVVVELWEAGVGGEIPGLERAFAQGGSRPALCVVRVRRAAAIDPGLWLRPCAQPERRMGDVLREGEQLAHVASFGDEGGMVGELDALLEALFPNVITLHERLFGAVEDRLAMVRIARGEVVLVFVRALDDPLSTEQVTQRQVSSAQALARVLAWPPPARREAHLLHLVGLQQSARWRWALLNEAILHSEDRGALVARWLDDGELDGLSCARRCDPELFEAPEVRARLGALCVGALAAKTPLSSARLALIEHIAPLAALPHLHALLKEGALDRELIPRVRQLVARMEDAARQAPERGGLSLSADPAQAGGLSIAGAGEGALSLDTSNAAPHDDEARG